MRLSMAALFPLSRVLPKHPVLLIGWLLTPEPSVSVTLGCPCPGMTLNLPATSMVVTSWKELNLTHSLCNATSVGCWVGGELVNTSQGSRWIWSDNSSYWDGSLLPGNLLSPGCNSMGCPSNSSVGSCTLVANTSASLAVEDCRNLHSFVCMVERDNRCSHVHCHREYFIILVVVGGIIFCTAVAVVVWLLLYKRSKKRKRSRKFANPSASSALVPPSWKLFNNM